MTIDRTTFLAKAAVFKREGLTIEDLGTVNVREVSAVEAREYLAREKAKDADELTNAAWLAVRVVCDDQGAPILTEDDIPAIRKMPIRVLKAISSAAARMSGWDDDSKKNDAAA
jgi:hypothetical protein